MNITGFGLPDAYTNPQNAGGATGINLVTWVITEIGFEGTQRALFSMLFGASVILFTSRLEAQGRTRRRRHLYAPQPLAGRLRHDQRLRPALAWRHSLHLRDHRPVPLPVPEARREMADGDRAGGVCSPARSGTACESRSALAFLCTLSGSGRGPRCWPATDAGAGCRDLGMGSAAIQLQVERRRASPRTSASRRAAIGARSRTLLRPTSSFRPMECTGISLICSG